jgi:hypothetical protein
MNFSNGFRLGYIWGFWVAADLWCVEMVFHRLFFLESTLRTIQEKHEGLNGECKHEISHLRTDENGNFFRFHNWWAVSSHNLCCWSQAFEMLAWLKH